jgi:hypothetical protein
MTNFFIGMACGAGIVGVFFFAYLEDYRGRK